jgi:hypothetical protein
LRRGPLNKNSVPAHVVRLYGEFDSGKNDSNSGGGWAADLDIVAIGDHPNQVRSCRHVLRSLAVDK